MSLIKKSDVKNHLSARFRKEIHLDKTANEPVATGFSPDEPGARTAGTADFAQDFQAEHSSSDAAHTPSDPLTAFVAPQWSATPKSVRG